MITKTIQGKEMTYEEVLLEFENMILYTMKRFSNVIKNNDLNIHEIVNAGKLGVFKAFKKYGDYVEDSFKNYVYIYVLEYVTNEVERQYNANKERKIIKEKSIKKHSNQPININLTINIT